MARVVKLYQSRVVRFWGVNPNLKYFLLIFGSFGTKIVTEADGLAVTTKVTEAPATGPPGTVFTYTGRGFKGGFGATSHLEGPDGLEWQAKRFPITPAGTFEHPILSGEFRPGTYTVWATDDYTKAACAKATFRVLASAAAPR